MTEVRFACKNLHFAIVETNSANQVGAAVRLAMAYRCLHSSICLEELAVGMPRA